LGGWSATLIALLIAPPLEKVRDKLFPPPPPPTPGPSAAQMNRLIEVNEFLCDEVRRLRESSRAREEPPLYEMDIRVVFRRRRPNADSG
jgi:hypothetical protein